MHRGCTKEAQGMHQGCTRRGAGTNSLRARMHQGWTEDAPRMHRACTEDAPHPSSLIPAPSSLRSVPFSVSHVPLPGPAECAERLNTASPLLGLSRVESTKQKKSLPEDPTGGSGPPRIPPGRRNPTWSDPPFTTVFH